MDQHLPSNSSIALIIAFLTLITIALQKCKNKTISNRKLPPGPRTLPIIGNMHQLIGAPPHRRLADLAKTHGPVLYLKLGQVANVVISSKQAAEEVLRINDMLLAQRPITPATAALTYNCRDIGFAPYGEYWRQVRKVVVLHLTSIKQVESYRSVRESEAAIFVRSISSSSSGSPVNLTEMFALVMTNIISRTSFGDSSKQLETFVTLVARANQLLARFNIAALFPSIRVLQWVTGVTEKVTRLHREIDDVLESVIAEYRASGRTKTNDILGVLLDLQDQGDPEYSLSTESIKAILFDVFSAGIDTSALIIEWAFAEIFRHPEVMKKLQDEVRLVYQNKSCVDESNLHQLKYMNLVLKETLRLHPAMLTREARESLTINGYEIPPKTIVLVNAWAIGRDPEIWVDAEKFRPERFLGNSIDFKGGHIEFIPFGAGRRMCPGIVFGMSNVEIMLANLLYHFNWELPDGQKPESLDMTELQGFAVKRKHDLCLIATQHCP